MRVAIVHDWLYVIGGAERVLKELISCYPDADLFTIFDALSDEDRKYLGAKTIRTSFLQKMPFISRKHRFYLPFMPFAIEQFDLSEYDLVISSSASVAKGVLTGPDQIHISYVHSPMRYAWDLQHAYLAQSKLTRGLRSVLARMMLHWLRIWDVRTAFGPDVVIANSSFVARRIRKSSGRKALVVHPPVVQAAVSAAALPKKNYFLAASRLVPYKNIDRIVAAFADLPDERLIVAGDGPLAAQLRAAATPNVTFTGYVADAEMRRLMGEARAFIFAAEEDFGIIPVEAQAEGTPVLALERGGACETVVKDRTGLFFDRPQPDAIARCVREFIAVEDRLSPEHCREQAAKFTPERFRNDIEAIVSRQMSAEMAI